MTIVKAKYVKYSMCGCGYPALGYQTDFGHVFTALPEQHCLARFRCGGCGSVATVKCIMIDGLGFRPECLFELTKKDVKTPHVPRHRQSA